MDIGGLGVGDLEEDVVVWVFVGRGGRGGGLIV